MKTKLLDLEAATGKSLVMIGCQCFCDCQWQKDVEIFAQFYYNSRFIGWELVGRYSFARKREVKSGGTDGSEAVCVHGAVPQSN